MAKIVIITDTWHNNVNGVVKSIVQTQAGLERRGHTVRVIHPREFWTVALPTYSEIRLAIKTQQKIAEMIKAEAPDHIHIATEGPLGWAALRVCAKNGWKCTTTYHTHLPDYVKVRLKTFKGLTYRYIRWFHNAAERTFVSTPILKEHLETRGVERVVIVPLGIDTETFKRNPNARLPENLKRPVFTFLGRIAPEKNIPAFLELDLPGSKLVIGDGPDREELESKYGSSATFTGFKKGQELIDLLSTSDVLVFPSKTDTFGFAIVEALACEVPIAAYDVPGPKDIITHGVEGFLGGDLRENALRALDLDRSRLRVTALQYSLDRATDAFELQLVYSGVGHQPAHAQKLPDYFVGR